ncbi:MAG: CHAP domain-containing protein [Chloroflexi bacterium]|nr:MAG: CHAP domain-containing protein [Chloroflexota bacterium]
MRKSQKAILIVSGLAALLATGIGSISKTQATTSPLDRLRAQRAALVAELAGLQPDLHTRQGAAGSAEAAFEAQQQTVATMQARLDHLNSQLLTLSRRLADDQVTLAKDKHDLAQITRSTYETTGGDQVLAAVLSADNFGQAMDRLRTASHVSKQVENLVTGLLRTDSDIRNEQASIQKDIAADTQLEESLANERNRLLALAVSRQAAFSGLQGRARQVAAQIANIDQRIAFILAPPHVGTGACGNSFAYGTCTWYVATRRCIPWGGNARDWYRSAAAIGYKEGHTPVPGAVVAFWPGGDGASWVYGHVGYVEAVGPASGIGAGYFRFSEMNATAGWNRVDYRTLANNDSGIEGFIYGR